jgi:hypothetical protein
MTDETTATTDESAPNTSDEALPWDPDTDPDGYTLDDVSAKDLFLDILLDFSHGSSDEHTGGRLGLTVISGGTVVSGIAISRAEWVSIIVDLYKQPGTAGTAPHVEKLFNSVQDGVEAQAKSREGAGLPARARGFLHMKDARLGVGNVTTQVPLWRGNLADITGWSLGAWNPPESLAAD